MTPTQIDTLALRYLERMTSLLPGSPALDACGDGARSTSGKRLVGLLELREYGSPLRLLTQRHRRVYCLRLLGRGWQSVTQDQTWQSIEVERRGRKLRNSEIADATGHTERQVRRLITEARHLVASALREAGLI